MVKLVLAALVAYFTATVQTEHRLTTAETKLELLEKIDINVQWLVKESINISTRVSHLEDQPKPQSKKR